MQNITANSVLLVKMMKTHELEKWHQVIVYPHRNGHQELSGWRTLPVSDFSIKVTCQYN